MEKEHEIAARPFGSGRPTPRADKITILPAQKKISATAYQLFWSLDNLW